MGISVVAYDIGCEPSPSVTGEVLLASSENTFLIFEAFGGNIALLECGPNASVKLGYPNDEGLMEHPYYKFGMEDLETDVMEVLNSPWSQDIMDQISESGKRIWSGRGMDYCEPKSEHYRHFVIALKEKTFECICTSINLIGCLDTYAEAQEYALGNLGDIAGC